ncbi:MAG: ABC transporter ATP-binding protein [Actinomycetota bacterium]|nr:ABC transporter ATP-binding protein [Actinomycetota bacterium]
MTTAIEVHGLKKSYGDVKAVRGIDLRIQTGEVFALLGTNGAGKTTTVEILEGFRRADAGDVEVLGFDPGRGDIAFKRRIGIVLQSTGVEPYLTVAETIDLFRSYYPSPLPRDEIIEVVGLQEKKDEPVRELSGGQQRRLDVAIGLAGDPDLLFLDEPTTGFDPGARRQAWEMVRNLAQLGKTVFLTTHYMDEAQNLAGRVAIIVAGRIVAQGAPRELSPRGNEATIRVTLPHEADGLPQGIVDLGRRDGPRLEIVTKEPARVLHDLTGWALEHDIELTDLEVGTATLEDVYLELTAAAAKESES